MHIDAFDAYWKVMYTGKRLLAIQLSYNVCTSLLDQGSELH